MANVSPAPAASSRLVSDADICVTGIAGSFPESDSVQELSENLFSKRDLVTEDDRRWKSNDTELLNRMGKVNNLEKFDAEFFGIGYKEAHMIGPMLRIVMEKVYECIFDAGVNPFDLNYSNTGVFIGCVWSDSDCELQYNMMTVNDHGLNSMRFMLAHRVSEWLKLTGPSYIVDSACSSSMFALENAFKSMKDGVCDAAIVIGINLCLHPVMTLSSLRQGVLSSDGKCKCFDNRADGFARSESVSACFLQKAKYSRRIYAKLVHARCNCDGFKSEGLLYPSFSVQQRLMEDFYQECGVDPNLVEYIEAHASGTRAGDLQEVKAITAVFCKDRNGPLLIGGVKSNLGHTEAASGLTSLVKVCIAYNTGYIPPNINFELPNKAIPSLSNGQLKVVTEKTIWNRGYFAINNWGFGGANAHVLMGSVSKSKANNGLPADILPRLVCVSSRTAAGLNKIFDSLESRTVDVEEVRLWHAIYKNPIKPNNYRGFILLHSTPEKSMRLARDSQFYNNLDLSVCFKYSTLETHWRSIALQLMSIPIFNDSIQRFSSTLEAKGVYLTEIIVNGKSEDKFSSVGTVVVNMALTDVLKATGIEADCIKGEGIVGSLCGAYAGGSITAEQALMTAYKLDQSLEVSHNTHSVTENTESFVKGLTNNLDSVQVVVEFGVDVSRNGIVPLVTKSANNIENLFESLGKLYMKGLNFDLSVLYPSIEFPVAHSTPMLSHLVSWDHSDNWLVPKYKPGIVFPSGVRAVTINLRDEHHKFYSGHVGGGRIVFPASGYCVLIWETFALMSERDMTEVPVVLEDIRFTRAINLDKDTSVELVITINNVTGRFEVTENSKTVSTGRIYEKEDVGKTYSIVRGTNYNETYDHQMNAKDVYKEFHLRGFECKESFQSIHDCNIYGTKGNLIWLHNWVTFIDAAIQVQYLNKDHRPDCSELRLIRLDKLSIDPQLHKKVVVNCKQHQDLSSAEVLLPFRHNPRTNVVKAGGVEMRGCHSTTINKKPSIDTTLLEKYTFVPNCVDNMPIEDAIRVNMQIIMENYKLSKCKVIEINDDMNKTNDNQPIIVEIVGEALRDMPLVQAEFVVVSQTALELSSNVTVSHKQIVDHSKAVLVIAAKLLSRIQTLEECQKILDHECFILSRETTRPGPDDLLPYGLNIITIFGVASEYLVLFRKRIKPRNLKYIKIEKKDDSFSWIEAVKAELNQGSNIVLYNENEPNNGLLGLVTSLRKEYSERVTGLLIADTNAPKFQSSLQFYQTQCDLGLGLNVFKNGQWGTYRYLLLKKPKPTPRIHAYLKPTVRGDLSSLRFIEGPLRVDSSSENTNDIIHVYSSALNCRDIMTASGSVAVDFITEDRINQECVQGFEVAGKLSDGTRVMAFCQKGISNLAEIDKVLQWRIPDHWTFSEAATVPVAYATVYMTLVVMSKMRKGESILIHSGASDAGQAAVRVALAAGLTVYTTDDSENKREFIKRMYPQINDKHVGNSQDTSFEELIHRETNGRGVDIVLNSLSDEKLQDSIKFLKPGGRFFVIGRYDVNMNTQITTCFINRGISIFNVMLEQNQHDVQIRQKLQQLVQGGIESGVVRPLTYCTFGTDEVESAFRYMAAGKHIGKVVIKIRDEDPSGLRSEPSNHPLNAIPRFSCRKDGVYIIVGGLGGMGLELADWLIMRGARKLVLTSRRGVSNGYRALRINFWQRQGVEVFVCATAVVSTESTAALLAAAAARGTTRAIFNLALLLKDGMFCNQTIQSFKTAFEPKAKATILLDELSRTMCPELEHFVIFSSLWSGRGNAGQTNYGYSNSAMEQIIERRKREGLPALAIQWGPVEAVGIFAKIFEENKQIRMGGVVPQGISSCLDTMDVFMTQDAPIVSSILVAENSPSGASNHSMVDAIANILGITDIGTIFRQVPFSELGMDSLMTNEIQQTFERHYEIFLNDHEIRQLTFNKLIELSKPGDEPQEAMG